MTADADDAELAGQRVGYPDTALVEADLAGTPLAQLRRWYADALAAGLPEPNAMVLATVDGAGSPSARTVLLKQADARGFVFYTHYGSRKAVQIEDSPEVALLLPWVPLHRQVAVRGRAQRVPVAETAQYFTSRPWPSRIGAWASRQSAPLAARADLDRRFAELARRWPDTGSPADVPVPPHWGGYLVAAREVEFWQGRPSRLHDRLVFCAVPAGQTAALDDADRWRLERRQP